MQIKARCDQVGSDSGVSEANDWGWCRSSGAGRGVSDVVPRLFSSVQTPHRQHTPVTNMNRIRTLLINMATAACNGSLS